MQASALAYVIGGMCVRAKEVYVCVSACERVRECVCGWGGDQNISK